MSGTRPPEFDVARTAAAGSGERVAGGTAQLGILVHARFHSAQARLTSNSLDPASAPSTVISTLYFPTGQPDGLEMWNSVRAGPVGATVWVVSSTTLAVFEGPPGLHRGARGRAFCRHRDVYRIAVAKNRWSSWPPSCRR